MSFNTPWPSKRPLCLACVCCALVWHLPSSASPQTYTEGSVASHSAQSRTSILQELAGGRLQGQATLRFFGFPVYHARLWVRPDFNPERFAEHAFALELEYQRDFKGQEIAKRSLQEMRRVGGFSPSQAERWLAVMQAVFPDVQKGDRLAGLHEPGVGVRFWLNGQPVATVADAEFGPVFFAIWLAPTTSQADMRLALLGHPTSR